MGHANKGALVCKVSYFRSHIRQKVIPINPCTGGLKNKHRMNRLASLPVSDLGYFPGSDAELIKCNLMLAMSPTCHKKVMHMSPFSVKLDL